MLSTWHAARHLVAATTTTSVAIWRARTYTCNLLRSSLHCRTSLHFDRIAAPCVMPTSWRAPVDHCYMHLCVNAHTTPPCCTWVSQTWYYTTVATQQMLQDKSQKSRFLRQKSRKPRFLRQKSRKPWFLRLKSRKPFLRFPANCLSQSKPSFLDCCYRE